MKPEILKELESIEETYRVKILYAVESGSRAWGFESTDSDWDVRYIYAEHPEWYLAIDDKKDSREIILPNDIDLGGWELRKALRLFRKSNPPLLEWLRSPIIYSENKWFIHRMRSLADQYFNPRSCMQHYLHMAKRNFLGYMQSDMIKSKKYFYVLRPVLACQWIERTNMMAPMEFQTLVSEEIKSPELYGEIQNLLKRKMNGEELREEPKNEMIWNFLNERISYYSQPGVLTESQGMPDTEMLNGFFRETLKEVWG